MGYQVTVLSDDVLSKGELPRHMMWSLRVFAHTAPTNGFPIYQPRLMEFVRLGGTLLVQYNTNNFLSTLKAELGPYPFKITRDRVTDENAKITILDSTNTVFNYPNKITQDDFKGWIQERGIYFAGDWDKQYSALLSMNDPGENFGRKSHHGKIWKGHYIYRIWFSSVNCLPVFLSLSIIWKFNFIGKTTGTLIFKLLCNVDAFMSAEEKPRFFSTWTKMYAAVIIQLLLLIGIVLCFYEIFLMSSIDWIVLIGTLLFIVLYGMWKSKGDRTLMDSYWLTKLCPGMWLEFPLWPHRRVRLLFLRARAGLYRRDAFRAVLFWIANRDGHTLCHLRSDLSPVECVHSLASFWRKDLIWKPALLTAFYFLYNVD